MNEGKRTSFAKAEQEQEVETSSSMKRITILTTIAAASLLAIIGGVALDAQNPGNGKYSLLSPDGIAFSDFKGYEDWSVVSSRRAPKKY